MWHAGFFSGLDVLILNVESKLVLGVVVQLCDGRTNENFILQLLLAIVFA